MLLFTIIFLITLTGIGLVAGIIYLLYLPFKRRLKKSEKLSLNRSKQINTVYVGLVICLSLYLTYDAFYPGEAFYTAEFETVTLRKLPESAEFIDKSASYPDFHGDYCSSSQIKLSRKAYANLLQELNTDNRMIKDGEITGSEEFSDALDNKSLDKIKFSFTRKIPGKDDHYLYIGFYDDAQTIFVNVCVT